MSTDTATTPAPLPKPLALSVFKLQDGGRGGIPSRVKVSQWGTPLSDAKHVLFYFGGMPASCEGEPPLHSIAADGFRDVYAARSIHMVYIDKPGMGQTAFSYNFSIRRDWPVVVASVADRLGIARFSVMGMSNGGPYVMACLTHPNDAIRERVQSGCVIVGVSDVSASGYFARSRAEGIYNSLPIALTAPLTYALASLGRLYLLRFGGFESAFKVLARHPEAKQHLQTMLDDAFSLRNYLGVGAALDCQLGLSPLYTRPSSPDDPENAAAAYGRINVPVTLWYGTKDSSVPMESAEWLQRTVPNATLHTIPTGHGLYMEYAEQVLDNLVTIMDRK